MGLTDSRLTGNPHIKVTWSWQSNPNPWSNDEPATWSEYPDTLSKKVEEAFISKKNGVDLGNYVVHFKKGVQARKGDLDKQRRIRRQVTVVRPESSSSAKSTLAPKTINRAFGTLYQFINLLELLPRPEGDFKLYRLIKIYQESPDDSFGKMLQNITEADPVINAMFDNGGGFMGMLFKKDVERSPELIDEKIVPVICQYLIIDGTSIGPQEAQQAEKLANGIKAAVDKATTGDEKRHELFRSLLKAYTAQTFLYSRVNKMLREEIWEEMKNLLPFVYYMTCGFAYKEFAPKDNVKILYRGAKLKKEMLDAYLDGKAQVFSWNGFTSTSKNPAVANHFGKPTNDLFPVVFEIEVGNVNRSQFADVGLFSDFQSEEEVILAPTTLFGIKDIKKNGDIYMIYLRSIGYLELMEQDVSHGLSSKSITSLIKYKTDMIQKKVGTALEWIRPEEECEIAVELLKNPGIRYLFFGSCFITSNLMGDIGKLFPEIDLRSMSFVSTNLTSDCAKMLASYLPISNLRSIELNGGCKMSVSAFEKLLEGLPGSKIENFLLSCSAFDFPFEFGKESILKSLLYKLSQKKKIRRLALFHFDITINLMETITHFLATQPFFFIYLRRNTIQYEAAAKLAYFLETIGKNIILQENAMDLSVFSQFGTGNSLLHLAVTQNSPYVSQMFFNSDTLMSLEVELTNSDKNIIKAIKSCKRLRRLNIDFEQHFELLGELEFLSGTMIEDLTIKARSYQNFSIGDAQKAFGKIILSMPFLKNLCLILTFGYKKMIDELMITLTKLLPYLEVKEFVYYDCSRDVELILKEAAKKCGCKCEKYIEPYSSFDSFDKKANEKPLIERITENKSETLEISEQYVFHEEEDVIEEALKSNLELKKLILDYDMSGIQLDVYSDILPKTNIESLKIYGGEMETGYYKDLLEENMSKTKIKELAIENSLNFGEKLSISFDFLGQSCIEKLSLVEKMDDMDIKKLAANIAKSAKLVELQLYLTSVSDETLKILWENICESQVKKLTLISNELKTYSMRYLPELLQKSKLEFVVLKNFALDDEISHSCLESLSKSRVKYFRDANKIAKLNEESQSFEVTSPLYELIVEIEKAAADDESKEKIMVAPGLYLTQK